MFGCHVYFVLAGMTGAKDRVKLVHVEVENFGGLAGQKLEADVLRLVATMDLLPIARGSTPC